MKFLWNFYEMRLKNKILDKKAFKNIIFENDYFSRNFSGEVLYIFGLFYRTSF